VIKKSPTAVYEAKVAELHKARAELAKCAEKEIAILKKQTRKPGDLDSVLAERRSIEALITRLEGESSILYEAIPRPAEERTPQQIRNEMLMPPAPAHRGGSAEQLADARAEQRALQREFDLAKATASAGEIAKIEARIRETDLKIYALEGPPYPQYMPWASKADLLKMRERLGLK
jgi:hypothetical protein